MGLSDICNQQDVKLLIALVAVVYFSLTFIFGYSLGKDYALYQSQSEKGNSEYNSLN